MRKVLDGNVQVNIVRVLIIIEMTAMLVSTAAAVGVEFMVYLMFVVSGELRRRFGAALRQPMVLMSLLFYAVVTVGLFYGMASWEARVDGWSAWRKLLMVPLAAAVFGDPAWKRRLAVAFIGFTGIAATVSIVSKLLERPVYYRFPVGTVLTNHATQGMALALAIFAVVLLLRFVPFSRNGFRMALAALAVLTADLIFVNTGRSGYLAFMAFGMTAVFVAVRGRIRFLLVLILPVLVGLLLMASPVARQKITLGISEIAALDQAEQYSSMGIRMVIYRHALSMLQAPEFPWLTGRGTGSFRDAYRPRVAGQTGWKAEVVNDPHNQYLGIAIEHGAVGLVLFFGFLAACCRQTAGPPYKALGIGALLAWCATSLFNSHFNTFTEGRMIFIWLGAMLAMPAGALRGDAVRR